MKKRYLLAGLLLWAACGENLNRAEGLSAGDIDASAERAGEVEILYSDSAVVRVRLTGPTLVLRDGLDGSEPGKEFPDGVVVEFFDAYGRPESRLRAGYGIQYERRREVLVRDSVVLADVRADTLFTDELLWSEREERIHSTKFVRVATPKEVVYGYGFESDQNFKNWRITAITGRFAVEGF